MPLTDLEFEFLDAYVSEAFAPELTGPATQVMTRMGLRQSDLSWLLTAHYRQAKGQERNPMGSRHPDSVKCPWGFKEAILARERELQKELDPESQG